MTSSKAVISKKNKKLKISLQSAVGPAQLQSVLTEKDLSLQGSTSWVTHSPEPLDVGVRHGHQNVVPSGGPLDVIVLLQREKSSAETHGKQHGTTLPWRGYPISMQQPHRISKAIQK